MKNKNIDLTTQLKEIDQAEAACLEKLKNLRQQRLELTKKDIIPFTVSTIHRDRRYSVIRLFQKLNSEKDFDVLENEWNSTADANTNGWFGTIESSGEKEKLLKILPKLAKNGCTVEIDPKYKITVPAPDKWWHAELQAELHFEKFKPSQVT